MKYKRILRIFGAALILSLLMAVIPAIPALAFDYTISISPTQGKIGDTIHINGSSFTPSTDTSEKHARIIFAPSKLLRVNTLIPMSILIKLSRTLSSAIRMIPTREISALPLPCLHLLQMAVPMPM